MAGPLLEAIVAHLMPSPPQRLGIAVSGGGDSMALLCLLADFARDRQIDLRVVTVDHGLRPEAEAEIGLVADLCARLGVRHAVERWSGWDGQGNLQEAARDARYALMAGWASRSAVRDIALAHTLDDQAETLLMRLARGAGVDGLSGMAPRREHRGVLWHRPLLSIRRTALREALRARGELWSDDPSNENLDFERVRMRAALAELEPLGLTAEALSHVAENMRRTREALDWQTLQAARSAARVRGGAIAFDPDVLRELPDEIIRRLVVAGVMWLTGRHYPPRRATALRAVAALRDGAGLTLDGCQIARHGTSVWLLRELAALRDVSAAPDELWDGRWTVSGPGETASGLSVRALGAAGLASLPEGWSAPLPKAILRTTPAVWQADRLVAAPLAGMENGWIARLAKGDTSFFDALLSH